MSKSGVLDGVLCDSKLLIKMILQDDTFHIAQGCHILAGNDTIASRAGI